MAYQGDIKLGNTLYFHFTTRQISGAPSTLASSPVLSAYPQDSLTQLTAGITLSVDHDSVTGLNSVKIVASGGNGYATATDYSVIITTGTVNSVSVVGEVVGSFSIENRRADVQFWNGTQVATPATAGIPDVNVKNMNNVAATPITTIKAVQGIAVDGVITTLTNLPAITSNWLTAAGIAASALNGKGDWLLSSGYTAPSNLTAAQIATGIWQDAASGDFTAANSIGKSVMNGVSLGTGLTIARCTLTDTVTTYTGNTVQTADVAALITTVGAAGAGLTALAQASIWTTTVAGRIDVAVSTRLASASITLSGGIVSADIKKVNAVTVNGDGSATPWGP